MTREAIDYCQGVTKRDIELISRREFIRKGSLLLPAAMVLGGLLVPNRARAGSSIITRTIGGNQENAISISNGTWARPVTLPGGWNTIRMGIRYHFTDPGANMTGTPDFSWGFCSGTSNQYGDATTTHFVGMTWNFSATWTRQATGGPTGGPSFEHGGNTPRSRVRIGTSNTDVDNSIGGNFAFPCAAASNAADANVILFDLTKGSPNYTWQMQVCSGNSGGVGQCGTFVTSPSFLLMMGQTVPTPPSQYGQGSTHTSAVNEGTNGTLNAIGISFNRADMTAEIEDVAVALIA